MIKYKIRKATKKDIPIIVKMAGLLADYHNEIEKKYWNRGEITKDFFQKHLTEVIGKNNFLFLIVEHQQKEIGFFSADISPTRPYSKFKKMGHIANAYLQKKYRGQKIAKAALQKILNWFKKNKIKLVELTVDSRNSDTIKAWEALGFKEFMKKMKMYL